MVALENRMERTTIAVLADCGVDEWELQARMRTIVKDLHEVEQCNILARVVLGASSR